MKAISVIAGFIFLLKPDLLNAQQLKDTLLQKDITALVAELIFMYDYDQALREYSLFGTFDKSLTDSIENLPEHLKLEHITKTNLNLGNLSSKIMDEYIIPFDNKHTERLIEITEKYGFPSRRRLEKYYSNQLPKEFNPYIIFVHSQSKYWDQITNLMEKELELGNINRCLYGHLLWHVNGRSDFKYMLENGYQFVEKEDGTTHLKAVDCD